MIKVLSIVGARPQLMKAAVLSKAFKTSKHFFEILIHTGQHFDDNMSSSLISELFDKKPDYQLGSGGKSEITMLAELIVNLAEIIAKERPDYVISYGDTTTTLAGALASRKLNVKHVHVEAGVRNFDMHMPEEVNRVIVDRISDLNFCATQKCLENLRSEGYERVLNPYGSIFSGDLMFECFVEIASRVARDQTILQSIVSPDSNYVYVTLHRQSNVDVEVKLKEIVAALNEINDEIPVVMPLHPRTKKMLREFNLSFSFKTIPPVSYFESIGMIQGCEYVITDSGGLVREAFFAKKNSLFLLEDHVWPEIEKLGFSVAVSKITRGAIVAQYDKCKGLLGDFEVPIFGDGKTSSYMLSSIESHFKNLTA